MRNSLFISVLLACLLWASPGQVQAGEALDAFFRHLSTHTLQADFVITVSEDASQPINYPGTITMQGEQFALTMFDIEAAYDGKTLYVYSESNEELTLSTPTEQELVEANPFLYARALADVCTVSEQPSGDKQGTVVTLTPADKTAGIQKFTLTLKDNLPQKITIKEGKKQTTLLLSNAAYTTTAPAFRLDKPDAYLNDLR